MPIFIYNFNMKWLIIGTSWISQDFANHLIKNNETVEVIYSRKQETGNVFRNKINQGKVITNLNEALKEVEAVYIGSPNALHYDQAKLAIENDKHVMVEKPMTHKFELTKELFNLADKHKVKIMEAYVHVTKSESDHFPKGNIKTNFKKVSSKIKNNTFMQASTFNKEMYGGVIPDLGVYPISMALKINGPVKSFDIKVNEWINEVEIDCDITLYHENGFTSEFGVSKTKDGDNRLFINDKEVWAHISGAHLDDKMSAEIQEFLNNNESKYKNISLQTAKLVEEMKERINK